ncbi:hypothetical protein AVEN_4354-1 [Araneus ventricosus]|uniref:Uncharacterized protein n=1 Tax=Araneus ventricosus TaxID=182803 RepID=A0A4Y2LEM7_ARAVE|nr:hypothetical protein AVEN_4354-1 [Araneus ventricosus]
MFSLVILASRFEPSRGLFWDGSPNFVPRSDDNDDTELESPLQTSEPKQREGVLALHRSYRATGPIHRGSPVQSRFEPGTIQPQIQDLRPPNPLLEIYSVASE